MPKKIVRDVLGELMETGKATAKAGKKAAGDIVKQAGKAVVGQTDSEDKSSGLDLLEKGSSAAKSSKPKKSKKSNEEIQREQIKRLGDVDRRQSKQAYEQIQQQIRMLRSQRVNAPKKYETGKAEFDKEQIDDPESFFDKLKKRKEESRKKDLPGSKKSLGGTGEMARGTSG